MKKTDVQKAIRKLIKANGSVAAVADILVCSARYVELMRDGKRKPGGRLWRDIETEAMGK